MVSKLTRTLDYAIQKFTSSTPALDYAIIKLLRQHTRQWHHRMHLFPLNTQVYKLWRYDEKWPSYEDLKNILIHIFMNFDELNISYELIVFKISKNGLNTHPSLWLYNIKIHIIDNSTWLRDNKIIAQTQEKCPIRIRISQINQH